jgi:hypothetical protein
LPASEADVDRKKQVFIVHGRNLAARDALMAFLNTLGLRPMTWEIARSLTGEATPTTLESVQAGIKAAQCVIVLFTGDDMVRLRPEYGNEPFGYQPRPNVLFEAGYALAHAEKERTILIRSGASREISDLSGLNYVELNNSPERRRAIVERLRSAGCDIDDRVDYTNKKISGDFEAAFEPEESGPNILQRGGFTDIIVDSSISYSVNNLDLLNELESWLERGGTGSLRFNYLGAVGAQNWLDLSEDPNYGHSAVRNILATAVPELVELAKLGAEIDFISLGPGDGNLDQRILSNIRKRDIWVRNYYPLDISFELLQRTVSNIIRVPALRRGLKIKAIHGDFFNLVRYRSIYGYDHYPNVFCLLGYSFGNYNEADLLGKLREGMAEGDILIFDARLHQESIASDKRLSKEEQGNLVRSYSHLTNNRFAFGALDIATTAKFEDMQFGYEVNTELTVVPGALNVVTYCENVQTRLKRNLRRRINHKQLDLAVSTLYDRDRLVAWTERRGFMMLGEKKDGSTILLMLKRTD